MNNFMMSDDNIQACCRICLDKGSEHISIMRNLTVQLHLKSCLAVTVVESDQLPKVVCATCASQLCDFYNFQLNARCSQDWLESAIREKSRKQCEQKTLIQPLPDSEYNSDSLLEFLNNTENIEEYLNNLGKEDVPSIVNMCDKNNESLDHINNKVNTVKQIKLPSPKKKDAKGKYKMEIDVLDSDLEIVKELLIKETKEFKTKAKGPVKDSACPGCKSSFESADKLTQHLYLCDSARRYCVSCNELFDSKQKLLRHKTICHSMVPCMCNCGKQFTNKDALVRHYQHCISDFAASTGCEYRCKACGDTFQERMTLYKHAREHVLKAQMKMCNECGHNFVGDIALSIHKKKEHPVPENCLFRCKVCLKTTQEKRELYNHIQRHHASAIEPRRHLCETCGKSFATSSTLLRHTVHVHVNERPVRRESGGNVVEQPSELLMCEHCGVMVHSREISAHNKSHGT